MLTAPKVLDEYYLEVRCKLLEIAAIMDRYDRGTESGEPTIDVCEDRRMQRCRAALKMLTETHPQPNRAEQVALIFSDPVE